MASGDVLTCTISINTVQYVYKRTSSLYYTLYPHLIQIYAGQDITNHCTLDSNVRLQLESLSDPVFFDFRKKEKLTTHGEKVRQILSLNLWYNHDEWERRVHKETNE